MTHTHIYKHTHTHTLLASYKVDTLERCIIDWEISLENIPLCIVHRRQKSVKLGPASTGKGLLGDRVVEKV